MVARIVDCSAVAALIFVEAEAASIVSRLEGSRLLAPALLAYELANVCATKCRRNGDMAATIRAAFRMRARLSIELLQVDHDAVLDLATQTGLTAYDASYLWLAQPLDAELVTLDQKLARAAAIG